MPTAMDIYNEGERLKDEGKTEEAVEKFHAALEADDKLVLAHLALAVSYGKLGRHDLAVQHGQKACEIDPHDPFNFAAMSVTFQRAFAGTQNRQFIQMAEDAMARSHMLSAQH